MTRPYLFIALFSLLNVAAANADFTPTQDGLYATFDTTSGEFSAKLYFDQAPITVANFVGLAENTISHFSEIDGSSQNKNYYEGITFHRVIAGFVIQGGSPNGEGTDGPGYSFLDEINTELKHNKKGILSMANSGPNSNGSQFFVTLSATSATHLDGLHAVFGEVVDGIGIVDAIGGSATDANGKPTNSITINSVTITRKGAAAEAFDPTDSLRPFDPAINPKISAAPNGDLMASFPRNKLKDYFVYASTDLQFSDKPKRLFWSESESDIISHNVEIPADGSESVFYHYSELSFPWGESRPGGKFSFTLTEGFGKHDIELGEDGTATFTSETGSGECNYNWFDLGERIQVYFYFPFSEWYEVQVHIEKSNLNSGNTFMRVNDPFFDSFTHTGAFSYTPAP